MRTRHLFHIALGLALLSGAHAAEDPLHVLERERRGEAREQALQPAAPSIALPGADAQVLEFVDGGDPAQLPEPGRRFPIATIGFEGPSPVPPAELDAVARPFLGVPLGVRRITLLLARLDHHFTARGFVTTRAYARPQSVGAGTLTITIVRGDIEAVTVDGQAASGATRLPLPFEAGDTLRLDALEQGGEQINRLRSMRAQIQVLPGQTPGASRIEVHTQQGRPWRGRIGADNAGQDATGQHRTTAVVEADHLLGLYDAWFAQVVVSRDAEAQLVGVNVPIGWHNLSYTLGHSSYRQRVSELGLDGDSLTHLLGWTAVVQRRAGSKLAMDATLAWRRGARSLADTALDIQRSLVLRIGLAHSMQSERVQRYADCGLSRGLRGLGADRDADGLAAAAPHAQFTKLDCSVVADLRLDPAWLLHLHVTGQASRVGLIASEQFYLGGSTSVRGLPEGALAGDTGLAVQSELQWQRPPALAGLGYLPYLSADWGRTRLRAEDGAHPAASLGVGLRLGDAGVSGAHLSGDLVLAKPIAVPADLGRGARIHLSLNLAF